MLSIKWEVLGVSTALCTTRPAAYCHGRFCYYRRNTGWRGCVCVYIETISTATPLRMYTEGALRLPGLPGSEPFLPRIPGKKVWNTRLPCLESGLFCLESGLFCPESRLFCREFRACCLEFRAVLSRIPSLLFRIPSCSVENSELAV